MLSPKQKRFFLKVIPFGIIWGWFGLLYMLIEYGILGDSTTYPSTNNPYNFDSALIITPIISFIMGLFLGVIEVCFLKNLFVKRTFWQKILFKTAVYIFSILLLLFTNASFINSMRLDLSIFHPDVFDSTLLFITNFAFWSIVLYTGVITMVSLFIFEVSDFLGDRVFYNFFTGKYHRPRQEKRVFMFLDMKSSTTIAEKLGHAKYFDLLNKYYSDSTEAIIKTSGEVYQYAGDEIIVSWKLKKGKDNLNCIQCFFMIKDTFKTLADSYIKSFGQVPEFKAGFHYGEITTGEIGVLKKEIFFTGDVLNTTARIQASCNEYGTDNLISEELISQLDLSESYNLTVIGECELRGRQEKINLFSINRK